MHTPELPALSPHHTASVRNLVVEFERDPSVRALILGGSLAHGYARPDSDIDVAIVVETAEFQRRRAGGQLHYNNRALCTYEGGYIDGKYMDAEFLRLVALRGSDPARFAFQDSRILFSRIDGLPALLDEIASFPREQKAERVARFAAQLLAWRWYYREAVRHENPYLVHLTLSKLALFSCRIVLAENEMLFPYHKWMLRVAESAPRRPAGFPQSLRDLLERHSWDQVDGYCRGVLAFARVDFAEADAIWPTRFMKDTELRWMSAEPAIDEL